MGRTQYRPPSYHSPPRHHIGLHGEDRVLSGAFARGSPSNSGCDIHVGCHSRNYHLSSSMKYRHALALIFLIFFAPSSWVVAPYLPVKYRLYLKLMWHDMYASTASFDLKSNKVSGRHVFSIREIVSVPFCVPSNVLYYKSLPNVALELTDKL